MNVREEIQKYAAEEDKPILNWLLDRYHWSSQWSFVAKCTHVRYGTRSYETNRKWEPTKEGRALYEHEKEGEWISLDERSPVIEDFDDFHQIYIYHPEYGISISKGMGRMRSEGITHWMRTGIKKPIPPVI